MTAGDRQPSSRNPPQRYRLRTAGGEEFSILQWGERGPPVMLHHATGFCAAIWATVAEQLASGFRLFAFDARGHGDSTKHVAEPSWQRYATDLAEISSILLERCEEATFAAAVGHSLGGIAILTAAAQHPDLFDRLLLVEPVVIPSTGPGARKPGRTADSVSTRMRAASFPSRHAARQALQDLEPFRDLHHRVLDDYVRHGWADQEDGSITLKCNPHTEAAIYELGTTEVVDNLDAITAPVRILEATQSRFRPAYEALRQSAARFGFQGIDGSHLAPMEFPETLAQAIRDWLAAS